jgi:hypothetical protein
MSSASVESSETIEHLHPVAARMMLAAFPVYVREAFERRSKEIDYPIAPLAPKAIEAVLEMAIAGFLDGEALSFMDCQPRY